MCFLNKLKSLNKVKFFIGIFWFLAFFMLLYGATFKSSRSFLDLLQNGFSIILGIFILGILTVFLEKYIKNISITYFLFFYFVFPVLSMLSAIHHIFTNNIITNIKAIAYCGFLLFGIFASMGLIMWLNKQNKIFKFCFVICLFYYFPFLWFGLVVLGEFEK